MGFIIFLIVIFFIGGCIKRNLQNSFDEASEKHRIKKLNSNVEQLESDWHERVEELNINLNEAVRVKCYLDYFDKQTATRPRFIYCWPVEGAIACFNDIEGYEEDGSEIKITDSPSNWNVYYIELNIIVGVYKRNEACVIQIDDNTKMGFAKEDYDKIKNVYETVKRMTN